MKNIFIAGPCVIESEQLLNTVAERIVAINGTLGTDIIFKASFDKANRTSIRSFRGPGIERGLQMLADVKSRYGLRILTDIHESWQAKDTRISLSPDRPVGGSSCHRANCKHQESTIS